MFYPIPCTTWRCRVQFQLITTACTISELHYSSVPPLQMHSSFICTYMFNSRILGGLLMLCWIPIPCIGYWGLWRAPRSASADFSDACHSARSAVSIYPYLRACFSAMLLSRVYWCYFSDYLAFKIIWSSQYYFTKLLRVSRIVYTSILAVYWNFMLTQ